MSGLIAVAGSPVAAATIPEWITAVFAVAAGLASAAWAVSKWVADRADARRQARDLAEAQLRQEATVEQHRREDRAAELIVKLGDAPSAEARRWIAGALVLYPDEATKVLVNSLGHADEQETTSAITMTLASIGPSVLPEVLDAHRLARTVVAIAESDEAHGAAAADVLGATEMLRCTRRVIAHLMLEMADEERADLDLAGIDLSRMNFAGASLTSVNLRKAVLHEAVFARAKLKGANLRGARAADAVFSQARAEGTDLTGLVGPIVAIRLFADRATVHDAKLDGSRLDAARFRHASFLRASLAKAGAPGAVLDDSTIRRCHWLGVDLRKASARRATFDGVRLGRAVLVEADLSGAQLTGCRLSGIDAAGLVLAEGSLTDCNMGGAEMVGADLRGTVFTRCNLSGASLARADLRGARFADCQFHRTSFAAAKLQGTVFAGDNRTAPTGLVVPGGWTDAVFEDRRLEEAFASAASPGDGHSPR